MALVIHWSMYGFFAQTISLHLRRKHGLGAACPGVCQSMPVIENLSRLQPNPRVAKSRIQFRVWAQHHASTIVFFRVFNPTSPLPIEENLH